MDDSLRRKDDKNIEDLEKAVGDLTTEVRNLSNTFKEHQKKTEPMYLWFQNINFTKRTIMWVLGLIASIGGLILMYKEIIK